MVASLIPCDVILRRRSLLMSDRESERPPWVNCAGEFICRIRFCEVRAYSDMDHLVPLHTVATLALEVDDGDGYER